MALLAAALFAVVMLLATPRQQSELWVELGKGLIQVFAVVVLGAALKFIADDYQDRRRVQEQHADFRAGIYGRLVDAANVLRRAPILIEANRSVRTWSEQMLAVIDAGFELRVIGHEVTASASLPDPPFTAAERKALRERLEVMREYIDAIAREFRTEKKGLSEEQRKAELAPLEQRATMQAELWDRLSTMWSVADLTGASAGPPEPTTLRSLADFQAAYEKALDTIIRATRPAPKRGAEQTASEAAINTRPP